VGDPARLARGPVAALRGAAGTAERAEVVRAGAEAYQRRLVAARAEPGAVLRRGDHRSVGPATGRGVRCRGAGRRRPGCRVGGEADPALRIPAAGLIEE